LDKLEESAEKRQNGGESSYQYTSGNIFRSTAQQSTDVNRIFFSVWGHLEPLVYSATIENEETRHQRIFYACQTIRNRPGTLERVRQSMIRRVHACIDSGGGYFENLL
jgi:hypothetical protein